MAPAPPPAVIPILPMSLRIERVGELIKREVSMILERDFAFKDCIVTVHDAEPTVDLKECFVYVGILGPKHRHADIVEQLNKNRGAIQRPLYKRVTLRSSPHLVFRLDDSVERGVRILNAIDNLPPPAGEA